MFLHLISDEKFVDDIITFFERIFPAKNHFVFLTSYSGKDHKNCFGHIDILQITELNGVFYKELLKKTRAYEGIFIHYLDFTKVKFINANSKDINFVWMIWGGDAYKLLHEYKIYDNNTLKILENIDQQNHNKYKLIIFRFFRFAFKLKARYKKYYINKAIRRIKYCTTILPEEYEIFSRELPLKAINIPFNYGIKNYFNPSVISSEIPENILIGNSGLPSNNHLSVFHLLTKLKTGYRKIVVPLSYGDRSYIEHIKKEGENMFGNKFHPLIDHLPYPDYAKILSSCSVGFMNHYRQQGMGNIIILLWFGARLYLRQENPAYKYLCRNGLKIFSINDDEITLDNLTNEEKLNNKMIIEKLYNQQLIEERARNLIKIVTSH